MGNSTVYASQVPGVGERTADGCIFQFILSVEVAKPTKCGRQSEVVPDDPLNHISYLNESLLNISTGQILCVLMIFAGIAFLVVGSVRAKKIGK